MVENKQPTKKEFADSIRKFSDDEQKSGYVLTINSDPFGVEFTLEDVTE